MTPVEVRTCDSLLHILYDKQVLERIVAGAVRSTINAHGTISSKWNGSTTKRVASSIRATVKQQVQDAVQADPESSLVTHLKSFEETS